MQTQSSNLINTVTLTNQVTAHLLQLPNQQQSILAVFLPRASELGIVNGLIGKLLLEGSESRKLFVKECKNKGIDITDYSLSDTTVSLNKLPLIISGPTGSERELAQVALTLLTRSTIDPGNFEFIRSKMIRDLYSVLKDPQTALMDATSKKIYGPNRAESLGATEIISRLSNLSLSTVLQDYQTMLNATDSNTIMMVSSQTANNQRLLLEQSLKMNNWYPQTRFHNKYQTPNHNLGGMKYPELVGNPNLDKALIHSTWEVIAPKDPDYPAFCLLKNILGQTGEGSFFRTLREDHGLVYSLDIGPGEKFGHGELYNVNLEVDFDKIGPALQDIQQVVRRLAQNLVTPAILNIAKRQYLLKIRYQYQSTDSIIDLYLPWLKHDALPPSFQNLQDAIAQVTVPDIQRVANRVFNSSANYPVIGVSAPPQVLQYWFPSTNNYSIRISNRGVMI